MLRVADIFVSGVRHLLVAVAILATLTVAFGVHLHFAVADHQYAIGERGPDGHDAHHRHHRHHHHDDQNSHDGHDVVSKFTGDNVTGECDGEGNVPSDPDGCGHCHCSVPSTILPTAAPQLADSGFTRIVHRTHDVAIPDSISFQPDPPPAKG